MVLVKAPSEVKEEISRQSISRRFNEACRLTGEAGSLYLITLFIIVAFQGTEKGVEADTMAQHRNSMLLIC